MHKIILDEQMDIERCSVVIKKEEREIILKILIAKFSQVHKYLCLFSIRINFFSLGVYV